MPTDDPCPKCGIFIKAHPPSGQCPPRPLDGRKLREVYDRLLADKFEGDLHKRAASELYGVPLTLVTMEQRDAVKHAAFAYSYMSKTEEPKKQAFPDLEVLQWEERRSHILKGADFEIGDELLSMMVRFPGGPPFQVVVSGQTGRDEVDRVMRALFAGEISGAGKTEDVPG
jgi:hypothetical protein